LIILRKSVPQLSEAAFTRFVRKAARAAKLRGAVNVLVTTNRELQSLNRRFCGKNRATDVLSFPPLATLPEDFAGDIAISAEMAAANAKKLGHSADEEVRILALHGILHLAGYDHERDNGKMARTEERLRRALGLPAALIERASAEKASLGKSKTSPPESRRPTRGARRSWR